jgi:galactose mutarotase-like enzyme
VQFLHFSPDGDQGYPGNLYIRTTYTLTDEDEIKITYEAETDKITPISLTNHTYWNLTYAGYWDISSMFAKNYPYRVIFRKKLKLKLRLRTRLRLKLGLMLRLGLIMKKIPTHKGPHYVFGQNQPSWGIALPHPQSTLPPRPLV